MDPLPTPEHSVRFCGRWFSPFEMDLLRTISADREAFPNRASLARGLCQAFAWTNTKGEPKLMSARVALLRMERAGLLTLPAPTVKARPSRGILLSSASDPQDPVTGSLSDLSLTLSRVSAPSESRLWNELVHRWHYLGYKPLPGAQVRYLVRHRDQVVALFGFGASAWAVEDRDRFIGWSSPARQKNLPQVVNNARFLILPWVRVPNLASHLLSRVVRHLQADWPVLYGFAPVLLETFVETGRFAGTSYKAAGWIHVGRTKGRGKLDRTNQWALPVKEIFLLPLVPHFRERLGRTQPEETTG
jgi:hypothetical protein